jgi:hypothetical protein
MDTLVISNRLQSVGLERKIFDEVAQIIDEQHQELATKKDLKLGFYYCCWGYGCWFWLYCQHFKYRYYQTWLIKFSFYLA